MSRPPENASPKGAVFLDRDGTIVEDVGYLARPEDVVWYDDTIEALTLLGARFPLFVVSNQSGVALGHLAMKDVDRVNRHIHEHLHANGITIQEWYVCPHTRDEGCDCIKPKPTFLRRAAEELGLSLAHSYTIGDHPHDVIFASNVGATGLYLLTGHGEKHRSDLSPDTPVYPTLLGAARWIVENS